MILGVIGTRLFILFKHQLEEHVCPCAVLSADLILTPVCLLEAYEVSSPLCASITNVLELSDNTHNRYVL